MPDMTGDSTPEVMPPDPAVLAEPAALANVIDLVSNDERQVDGNYVGSWWWDADTTDGSTYTAINQTHGNGGERVHSAILWHDEAGDIQYLVTLVQTTTVSINP